MIAAVDRTAVALLGPGGVDDAQAQLFEGLLWFGAVLVAVMLAIVVALYARRRLRRDDPGSFDGFDLGDLRRLNREGELSDAEYEAIRRKLTGGARGSTEGSQTRQNVLL